MCHRLASLALGTGAFLAAWPWMFPTHLLAQQQMPADAMQHKMSPELMMPSMNPANGRKLFASKGCVVCHAVNGIGGTDAAALDASSMTGMTDPFDFVANMWRGAGPMIEMQQQELGGQVEFTGQELADIIAFLHHQDEQKKFSVADIPPKIKAILDKGDAEKSQGENKSGMGNMKMPQGSGN